MATTAEYWTQFEAWQRYANLSPKTIRRRERTLLRFAEHRDLATVTPTEIETWLGSLDIEPQSRGQYLADLRAFWVWALDHEVLTVDPAARVKAPKRPTADPDPIQVGPLMDAIDAAPEREKVMLTLAAFAGLRCIEISRLRLEDVDHAAMTLRVMGKGQKGRTIMMHPRVAAVLPERATGPAVSWRGEPISERTISDRLSVYLHSRGIDASAHKARHSYGTALYAACHDLKTVGKQLGHVSVNTTTGYVAASDEDARAAIAKLYET